MSCASTTSPGEAQASGDKSPAPKMWTHGANCRDVRPHEDRPGANNAPTPSKHGGITCTAIDNLQLPSKQGAKPAAIDDLQLPSKHGGLTDAQSELPLARKLRRERPGRLSLDLDKREQPEEDAPQQPENEQPHAGDKGACGVCDVADEHRRNEVTEEVAGKST
eukprot:UN4411